MLTVLLILQLTAPNSDLTPGSVVAITTDKLCATKWGLDARFVTDRMKKHTAAAYGVAWDDRGQYIFDHLIPRELGGADDVLNLWPQRYAEAKQKDRDENRLHKAVCAGTITLRAAQAEIRRWPSAAPPAK